MSATSSSQGKWRQITKGLLIALLALQLSAVAADKKHAPLPDKLVHAKMVFLQNDTGDQKLLDNVYEQINKWGRWQVVTDRSKADVLVILSRQDTVAGTITTGSATATGNTASGTAVGIPITENSWYLHVIDRESGQRLWTAKKTPGGLWITWRALAKALFSDLKERVEEQSPTTTHKPAKE